MIEAWQEKMGATEKKVTLPPSSTIEASFVLKGPVRDQRTFQASSSVSSLWGRVVSKPSPEPSEAVTKAPADSGVFGSTSEQITRCPAI